MTQTAHLGSKLWKTNAKFEISTFEIDFKILGRFGSFAFLGGSFWLVLGNFMSFPLVLAGFGSFWIVPCFSRCTSGPLLNDEEAAEFQEFVSIIKNYKLLRTRRRRL